MDVKVFELEPSTPIDVQGAVRYLGLNIDLFYEMLEMFENKNLTKNMISLAEAVNEGNYKTIKAVAHTIKGASGYIGASHIHYACYFI